MGGSDFTSVLSKIPYGVSVVTVGLGGDSNGLTVSWMSQVSFEPPHIMIAVDSAHHSTDILTSTKSFAVNLLKDDQKDIATHFAKQSIINVDKADQYSLREASTGTPILTDALAYLDCEVVQQFEVGGHTVFIGQVVDAAILNDGEPLTSASGMRYRE